MAAERYMRFGIAAFMYKQQPAATEVVGSLHCHAGHFGESRRLRQHTRERIDVGCIEAAGNDNCVGLVSSECGEHDAFESINITKVSGAWYHRD